MGTFTNSEEPNEIQLNVALHQAEDLYHLEFCTQRKHSSKKHQCNIGRRIYNNNKKLR